MTRPFRFGYQSRVLADHDTIVADARRAEALGYDELFSYDHVGEVDPFVPLVVAAEATTRLRVSPLVLNNELHHPALLARTAATVDRLSGGRLVLGLGTGYAQDEHDAIGLTLRPPGDRVARFDESLTVLRALLDDGRCAFSGVHHSIGVDDLGVRPAQAHVPFLVGGHGRRVVTTAARHADIFQFTGLTHGDGGRPSPGGFAIDDVEHRRDWLLEAAAGRADAIELSVLVQTTDVAVDAHARIDQLASRFGLDRDQLVETPFVLAGSVEQVIDEVERLRERLGVSHIVVREPESFAPVVAALRGR
ncbi:MAG: TIGR03621 family F420-dependent LLM class oxidoreductase [Actinobacteria bacterium]|nr:TIGR03621 family F420-dependent LLM class oxidoreductase [Actinomycetota bacterium]